MRDGGAGKGGTACFAGTGWECLGFLIWVGTDGATDLVAFRDLDEEL